MSDLDAQIQDWRQLQERETSLSPRELDELEDHLRARVDLELELNAALAPEQAFAITRRDLGEPVALSKEFAKAGKPRWRRWLLAGWAMYGAAWFLPTAYHPVYDITIYGYEAVARFGGVTGGLLFFSNLAMLATVPVLWRARFSAKRWFWRSVGAVGVCAIVPLSLSLPSSVLTVGYWTWTASYICVAAALRLRAKDGASAAVRAVDGCAKGSRPGRPSKTQPRVSGHRTG